jgi:hypothetical protein
MSTPRCSVALVLTLTAVSIHAADLSVGVVPQASLAAFHTFTLREAKVESARPEFDNPIFRNSFSQAIRDALRSRGLRQAASAPDLVVDYVLTNEDVSAAGSRPRAPRRTTKGTLVIDIRTPGGTAPVWRGTYRDEQLTGSELGPRLFTGARKLLDRYPKQKQP